MINGVQLNKENFFGPKEERFKVSAQLQSLRFKTTNQARNLGVVVDSDLNFNIRIKIVTKSDYSHFKNIGRIRMKAIVSQQDLEKLLHLQ